MNKLEWINSIIALICITFIQYRHGIRNNIFKKKHLAKINNNKLWKYPTINYRIQTQYSTTTISNNWCILYHKELIVFYRVYRHIAHRRFVLWIWHRLGRGNRKVLQLCVVTTIRKTFLTDNYTGFKEYHLAS